MERVNTKQHKYKTFNTHLEHGFPVSNDGIALWFKYGGRKGEKGE